MKENKIIGDVQSMLNKFSHDDLSDYIGQIDPQKVSDDESITLLNILRKKKRFSEMERFANICLISGSRPPVIRRQLAQSLIEQNRISQSLGVLEQLSNENIPDACEKSEITGLRGRAFKQRYVNEGRHEDLLSAIDSYRKGWEDREGDYKWHGINYAALLSRAKRDNIEVEDIDKATVVASNLLDDIENENNNYVWTYGTAMEASLVLNDDDRVLHWAKKYINNKNIDKFELSSTLRQLHEVWRLGEEPIGEKLIPILEYKLLQCEGGELSPTQFSQNNIEAFESVYGDEGSVYLDWMESLTSYCKSVARVRNTITGEVFGTGFVVKGSSLTKNWSDDYVFVTNAHVLSDNVNDSARLHSGDASAEFTRVANRPKIILGDIRYSSPETELDVTILEIKAPEDVNDLIVSKYNPIVAQDGDREQRIYVIGHPKGGELKVSLYDNDLKGYKGQDYVHYRSPTETGSSGSPVFKRDLKLFALHHKTIPALEVNEGVLLSSIIERL